MDAAGGCEGRAGKVVVVGLTGPSGVGKSSLSDRLTECLDSAETCTIIHGDTYFFAAGPPPPYDKRDNMELPSSVDFAALLRDLDAHVVEREARGGVHAIIVESFVLLACADLLERLDVVVFLQAEQETCLRRRLSRNPSRPANEALHLESYFRKYVWPSYQEHSLARLHSLLHAQTAAAREPQVEVPGAPAGAGGQGRAGREGAVGASRTSRTGFVVEVVDAEGRGEDEVLQAVVSFLVPYL
eukprot:Tamp_19406.p1 GENE.Tamp_19406~~Tamp_19406.p1  ORF type:complete len:243 (+),score=29.95 Tamp_19406:506-1234(+)